MKKEKRKPKRRQTRKSRIRKRGRGRPKGTLRRFPFDETRIGFMLHYEMPVVYHLIKQLCSWQMIFEPDWRVIDSVAKASKDPSYDKPKFKRYLKEYQEKGCFCLRGKTLTPERKEYYESIRKHKAEEYIRQNRRVIRSRLQEDNETGQEKLESIKNIIKPKA